MARALACRRGGRLLFEQLDLTLQAGQAMWLRGTNGRGKTSLLRMLAGVSRAAHGEVHARRPLVYLGHHDALKGDLTALESLAFLVRLHAGHSTTAAVDPNQGDLLRVLGRVGLASRAHLPVRALSQGQRKRVALARLGLCLPGTVWLLDEPLDALDDDGIALVMSLISDHLAGGGAVLLTSHQHVPGEGLTMFDLEAFAPRRQGHVPVSGRQPGAGAA